MKAKRQNRARSVSATMLDGTGGHVMDININRDRATGGVPGNTAATLLLSSNHAISSLPIIPRSS